MRMKWGWNDDEMRMKWRWYEDDMRMIDHFCLNKHGSRSTMCYLLDTFHAAACCCMLLHAAACCCMRLHAATYFSWSFPLRKPLLWLDSARSRQYEQLRCRPRARFAQNPMHCSYITSKQRWVALFMKNKKSKISAPRAPFQEWLELLHFLRLN